jgi:hypothetical protein
MADLAIGELLGEGQFGKVYKGRWAVSIWPRRSVRLVMYTVFTIETVFCFRLGIMAQASLCPRHFLARFPDCLEA